MIDFIGNFDAAAQELGLPRPSTIITFERLAEGSVIHCKIQVIVFAMGKVKIKEVGKKPVAVDKVRANTFHDARDITVDTWQADSIEAFRAWGLRLKAALES